MAVVIWNLRTRALPKIHRSIHECELTCCKEKGKDNGQVTPRVYSGANPPTFSLEISNPPYWNRLKCWRAKGAVLRVSPTDDLSEGQQWGKCAFFCVSPKIFSMRSFLRYFFEEKKPSRCHWYWSLKPWAQSLFHGIHWSTIKDTQICSYSLKHFCSRNILKKQDKVNTADSALYFW